MKINLAKSAGFCFGVKRAIDIALKISASAGEVCMLGDIVHNEDVVRQIAKTGIKKIKKLSDGRKKSLLIRAHGSSQQTLNNASRLGYNIVDATCPMVKEIHKIARQMEQKGYKIIIIGDKNHDEVMGIAGQLKNKAIVIDELDNIPVKSVSRIKKCAVVVQSTQNIDKVMSIVNALGVYIKELKFFNTICKPTSIRQEEIRKMPLENDIIIIIGSKHSANTKRLYEISKSLNPHSFWIVSDKDLQKNWFKGARSVGITAGASTPDYIMQRVILAIKRH